MQFKKIAISALIVFGLFCTVSANAQTKATLSQFVADTLGNVKLPGLSDAASLAVDNYQKVSDGTVTANATIGGISFNIIKFTPPGKDAPIFIIGAKNIHLDELVPGINGTPLGSLGQLGHLAFIYAPPTTTGKVFTDSRDLPQSAQDVLGSDFASIILVEGMNIATSISTPTLPNELKSLMQSVGLPSTYKIPLRGGISPSILVQAFGQSVKSAPASKLLTSSEMKSKVEELLKSYGQDFLASLDLHGTLPASLKIGPFELDDGAFELKGNSDNGFSFGLSFDTAKAHSIAVENLMVSFDADSNTVVAQGSIDAVSLAKGFDYKGLKFNEIDLNAEVASGQWSVGLDAKASLNGKEIATTIVFAESTGQQPNITVTLDGGKAGISAKDVAGRDIPGMDKVALERVVVSNGRLVADLEFGPNQAKGEIAAFHPQGFDQTVLAVTLDRLAFTDLIPGSAGTPVDGVSVNDITLIVIPPKSVVLKADDVSIPAEIAENLGKVLSDSGKAEDYALKDNINLFMELDLGDSGAMQDLMHFIGKDPKDNIPLSGIVGKQFFDFKAPKTERFKDIDLDIPLPKITLSLLPGAFSITNTEFKIMGEDPKGDPGFWVGLVFDLSADLMGQHFDFNSNIGFSKDELSLTGVSDTQFNSPFGISWLSLKELTINIDNDKKTRSGELTFSAVPTQSFGSTTPKILINLQEQNGKLTAGTLKIEEKVAFSDLPMLKGIPHADQFYFTFLEISKSGISGGTELHGEKVDAVIFEQNSKWVFAISDNGGNSGFKFDRIMPALKKTPLANFHLNDAALIFSETDISGNITSLPEVAQQVFTDIYGSSIAEVNVKNGITIAANFSPGKSSGFAAKGLQGIGIHDDILIEGTIENIFGGGVPGVDVKVDIEQGPGGSKGATHAPKMAKFPGKVGFFIQYKADELDVGLEADVQLHVPKNTVLELVTKMELELNEKGFGVAIFMDLSGNWKEPFGIPGIDLEEVAIKFGIDMLDEAKFGLKGTVELADGAERIDIVAEVDFELDALGLPDGIAMQGTISELGIPALIDIAERMAGGGANILPPNDIPLPNFKDVTFAFATPGAEDPQLGLVGMGFKAGGELAFMGQNLGQAHINSGVSGIKMDAEIEPIDLKVLKLENNQMRFELDFKSSPMLEIDSEIKFLGAKQQTMVKFYNGMADMQFEDKIGGGIWDSKIDLAFGFDPKQKGAPDIFIKGELKADFFKWLSDQAPAKVKEFFNTLNKGFDKAISGINKAEDVVRSWDKKIQARKEVVQREKVSADAAITRAKAKLSSVIKARDKAHDDYEYNKSRCHWYSAWHCGQEAYYLALYGIEEAAYEVAQNVLKAAKSAVDHLPSELMDPRLTALEGEQAAATAALTIAKDAIQGVESMDSWLSKGLSTLLAEVGKTDALVIKEAFFEADMEGMLKGEPMIMTMDLEIFGKDLGMQMFAFKITDPIFDVKQLVFVPLHMVSELFSKNIPSGLKTLLGPVLREIDSQSKKAEQEMKDELAKIPGLELPADVEQMLDGHAPASDMHPSMKSQAGLTKKKRVHVQNALKALRGKQQSLMSHVVMRNKTFGNNLVDFETNSLKKSIMNQGNTFVAYSDIHVPPGELFTERLLVARHSNLCLGKNGYGKITFHPCNENTGGLLWSTKRQLIDDQGHLTHWDEDFAVQYPKKVYTQLVHNGSCLTTPFHLQAYNKTSKQKHKENIKNIAQASPNSADAHLTMAACRPDGKGQLWKVVKTVYGQSDGFKLQERDSSYCLRPDSVKAYAKKSSKEVLAVFYPCTGIAHGTFALRIPLHDMPIWHDHNGVIKSDNGYCLDVPNDPFADNDQKGSAAYLKKCTDDKYDRWDYVVEYDKTIKIINDYTGHCLYPYDIKEGKIPNAQHDQLVQRPCDARYGQGWTMRVIPQSKWFQLESLNTKKKGSGKCMLADQAKPGADKINVFVQNCAPATRGRWEFGHWKGTYAWTEWTEQNSKLLSATYWVSLDNTAVGGKHNGVCRVIVGNYNTGASYQIYPGTWYGSAGICKYNKGGKVTNLKPSSPGGNNIVLEILSDVNIGESASIASWKSSVNGVPFDSSGQNQHPPNPRFSPFMAGGDTKNPAFYLCRIQGTDTAKNWYYGYQVVGGRCLAGVDESMHNSNHLTNSAQVLVFKTQANMDTGD